jgi:hypothetical protein
MGKLISGFQIAQTAYVRFLAALALVATVVVFLHLFATTKTADGQVTSISESTGERHANLIFDVKLKEVRESRLFSGVSVNQLFSVGSNREDRDFTSSIVRVIGGIGLPPGIVPASVDEIELFLEIRFGNPQDSLDFAAHMTGEKPELRTIGDREYISLPPSQGLPPLLMICRDEQVSIGTERFISKENRNLLPNERLRKMWQKIPQSSVRLAVDVQSMAPGIQVLLTSLAPENHVVEELEKALLLMDGFSVGFDPEAESIGWFGTSANSPEETARLNGMVGGLLMLARTSTKSALSELGFRDGRADLAIEELLEQLMAEVDGEYVFVELKRGENTGYLVDELNSMIRNALPSPQAEEESTGKQVHLP